jgi:hypothetical protein
MSKTKTQVAAVVTLRGAGRWTKRGRRDIAAWLRKQAKELEQYGSDYPAERATRARYCY